MTTGQIIIFIINSLVFIISLSFLVKKENEKYKESSQILIIISFSFITLVACLSVIFSNKMLEQNKCPEYEKVENVYKLKE